MSTLDLFDGRFTLLTGPAGAGWRAAADALAAVGLPITALSAGLDLCGDAGELSLRYGLGERRAVLVRPDGHCGPALPDVGRAAPGEHLRALTAAVDAVIGAVRGPDLAAVA